MHSILRAEKAILRDCPAHVNSLIKTGDRARPSFVRVCTQDLHFRAMHAVGSSRRPGFVPESRRVSLPRTEMRSCGTALRHVHDLLLRAILFENLLKLEHGHLGFCTGSCEMSFRFSICFSICSSRTYVTTRGVTAPKICVQVSCCNQCFLLRRDNIEDTVRC